MSSIVGLQGKFKGNDIVKMLKTSKNRGPDASGVYLGDVKLNIDLDKFSDDNEYDIAFGQNLLCVYDTNERQDLPQPVSNDKLVLVFDGVLYNFRTIRNLVGKVGVEAEIKSDAEALLYLIDFYNKGDLLKAIQMAQRLIEGDYAYFYEPYTKPRFLKIALNIGEQLGCKIVIDRIYPDRYIKDHKNVLFYTNTGPKEFLNLLKHAKLVIGHSLHAVLFSILYKRDFYALDGDKDSRMSYIMNALGLERRFVSIENPLLLENTHIDYWNSVYEKYELLKENSLSFLKDALSN